MLKIQYMLKEDGKRNSWTLGDVRMLRHKVVLVPNGWCCTAPHVGAAIAKECDRRHQLGKG